MRTLYLLVFIVLVAAILVFAFQNLSAVTVTFLGFSISAPMAAVVIAVYILGMLTGSSLFGALRKSWAQARQR
jgi:uncharacterized integral membrane protein